MSFVCAMKPTVAARTSLVARPAKRKATQARKVLVRGAPDKASIEKAIKEAEDACEGGAGGEW